jgi:hypothetical protein
MHFSYNGPNLKRRNEFFSLTPEISIIDIMQVLFFLQDFEIDIPTRSHKNTILNYTWAWGKAKATRSTLAQR